MPPVQIKSVLQNTLKAYPCGSDHTPSPMASRAPLEARAAWHTSAARLTAVAVSVRDGHSIAFLGDSRGTLHKVAHHCVLLWIFRASFFKAPLKRARGGRQRRPGTHLGNNSGLSWKNENHNTRFLWEEFTDSQPHPSKDGDGLQTSQFPNTSIRLQLLVDSNHSTTPRVPTYTD